MAFDEVITSILIILAVGVMLFGIMNTRNLLRLLHQHKYLPDWRVLFFLMIFILVGYVIAVGLFLADFQKAVLLLTGIIFFITALFMYLVVRLARLTADELLRTAEHNETAESLRKTHFELEYRIEQRTAELLISNTRLREEIIERQQAEEKFRYLLEFAPDAIVIVNNRGLIELVNEQTERLFGYAKDELIGMSMNILLPQRFRTAHEQHRINYMAEPRARRMGVGLELYGLRQDGSEFPVEISLSPLDTKEGLWVSSAIRDMTNVRRRRWRCACKKPCWSVKPKLLLMVFWLFLTSGNGCRLISDLLKCGIFPPKVAAAQSSDSGHPFGAG